MSAKRFPIVTERTRTGYSAYSPDVPGCASVGDTEEETRRNFQAALTAHFEAMREVGERDPRAQLLGGLCRSRRVDLENLPMNVTIDLSEQNALALESRARAAHIPTEAYKSSVQRTSQFPLNRWNYFNNRSPKRYDMRK